MTVLLVLGSLGVLLLLSGLLVGDAFDGAVDGLLGGLSPDAGLTPALGAALGAFGFGGALLLGPFGMAIAVVGGGVAALVLGVAAYALTKFLIGTDAAPVRSSDLLGVFGTVVTPIPVGGLGEVVLPQGGARVKLAARSHEPVPTGTSVYVVEVLSSTAVDVQRADVFGAAVPELPQ